MLKLEAAQREADETLYLLQLNEQQILDLSVGYVPSVVKSLALSCLNWADEDERKARRPVQEPKAKRRKAG